MNICVFAGPTLPPRDREELADVVWLPPAAHGDVHRAVALLQPRAIGIVDGYFRWAPAVRHQEILWAIQQGVHVFGAASMGALRAAELAPFGMRGVGRIYSAYSRGTLEGCGDEPFEDDDEVAVTHGPAESGYLAISESMVNIRCTLASAERAGVIGAATRAQLLAIAKALFFPDRGYELLLRRACESGLPQPELASLEAWLPHGRVNQKREDALAMLGAMRSLLERDPAPGNPRFTFEHTTLWERAFVRAQPATVHDAQEAKVLAELRLDAARWEALWREALNALMPSPLERKSELLPREASASQPHDPARMMEEAARARAVHRARGQVPPAIVERGILARMRATSEFEQLRNRADDKLARIADLRGIPAVSALGDLDLLGMTNWYFSRVLCEEIPDDIESWVRARGYGDLAQFHAAIFTEFVYRHEIGAGAAASSGVAA